MRRTIIAFGVAALPLVLAGPSTASLSCTITEGETATCKLSTSTTAVDLEDLVNQLATQGVNEDTIFWIQAWGGDGAQGNTSNGGEGGTGGFGQTITNLSAFRGQFGGTEFYYYLGWDGSYAGNAGGDGGTATLVTVNDLADEDVTLADTLLLAGGGGGGGGGRGKKVCDGNTRQIFGGNGGAGAVVFGTPDLETEVLAGDDGSKVRDPITQNRTEVDRSGQGGQETEGGAANTDGNSNSTDGGDPTAPLGGRGGNHNSPRIGFVNASSTKVTGSGGQGADGGDKAGGGGGGGGYTAGGGGAHGEQDNSCVSVGGGGGSTYVRTPDNSPGCDAAPSMRPDNPNSDDEGSVQIVFNLGPCG